uniref:TrmO family methyltransferase domain-containing protein n=1 Tax=Pseudoalteromonas sp. TaxID=53249 RepID=UPI003565D618
ATFRPNGIGMSAVKLEAVHYENGQLWLELSGVDLLDGTPILDIKPYLPYSDSLPSATAGFADTRPETPLLVEFSDEATAFCLNNSVLYPELQSFIEKVLKQDPRPAYKKTKAGIQEYGMSLFDLNIKWQVLESQVSVLEIIKNT